MRRLLLTGVAIALAACSAGCALGRLVIARDCRVVAVGPDPQPTAPGKPRAVLVLQRCESDVQW